MNYYERIQKSIDYIEDNLLDDISIQDIAKEAYMSISSFYRMFFSLVGLSVKEYIRNRRFSLAAIDLKSTKENIISIAIKYNYNNADAFSRAFKNSTGHLPSVFRANKETFTFKKINITEKYFNIQDSNLLKKYPNIKLLKEIPSSSVIFYNYFGKNPEIEAFKFMEKWINNNSNVLNGNYRIIGYNNPSPTSPLQEEYGYELCIVTDNKIIVKDKNITMKTLTGGLYVTTHVKKESVNIGFDIVKAWEDINNWISDSKYTFGEHQWFEEYLDFISSLDDIKEVDIYVPVKKK